MNVLRWRSWGIKVRLMLITVLPVLLMFFSIVFNMYFFRYADVQGELQERGEIIAYALAESSQYGVISGNLSYIDNIIRGLLHVDQGISRVEILDASKHNILDIPGTPDHINKKSIFFHPIQQELIDIDGFNESGNPHVSDHVNARTAKKSQTVGYVRIEMSPAFILAKQQHKIFVGASIAGVILLLSTILALYLSLGLTRPLAKTISVLREIRRGNYKAKLDVTATGEIGDLQLSIREMIKSLNQSRQNLEAKILARTRDLEVARDVAVKSNIENRKLIRKINSIVEEERKNIAIELHDHLNASLIVVRLESQGIIELSKKLPPDRRRLDIHIKASSIVKHSKDLYAQSRDLVRRLRPEIIDMLGLQNAVEEMVTQYNTIHQKCRFVFDPTGNFLHLKGDLPITVYRLIQEGLSNVVKHSDASACQVIMQCSEEMGTLRIKILDNGHGFDTRETGHGIGLIGMRERVYGARGSLSITSHAAVGTVIDINFPLVTE